MSFKGAGFDGWGVSVFIQGWGGVNSHQGAYAACVGESEKGREWVPEVPRELNSMIDDGVCVCVCVRALASTDEGCYVSLLILPPEA